jgi:succinyl-diaminopimelate desuccinylase
MERAFNLVEEKRQKLINVLRDIIHIDTSVPPGKNYDKMVNYLEPRFKEFGFNTERVVVPEAEVKKIPLPLEGPRVNLVATKKAEKEPVTIYAHMDVVPIEQKWTVDPFEGVVKEGRVYGRGACDMKGSIACLLVALEVMKELNLEPAYDMICTLCTDEEIGMYPGVYHLAKEGYVKGHVLCLELGMQEPMIILAAAGCVDVTVTTLGKSCHSGMNFLGVNAVEAMIPILEELMNLKHEVEKRESKTSGFPMPNAPSDKMTPMFNIDIIQGGTKSNIVPAECSIVINRRYIPEEKYEDVCTEIQEAIDKGKKRSKALDVKVSYCHLYPAFTVDPDSKYAKKMRQAYKAVLGFKEEDYRIQAGMSGSTDMAWVAQVLKTDKFVGTAPFTMKNISAHGADEYVEVRDLISVTKEIVYYLTH